MKFLLFCRIQKMILRLILFRITVTYFILNYLFEHCEKTEFQIRYRWKQNDMAFWDNRCTLHKAIWDYFPNERKGRRVTIKGDKPF